MHVDCWIQQVTTRVGAVISWIQQSVSLKQGVVFSCLFNRLSTYPDMAVLRPGHGPFRRTDRLRHEFWSYIRQDKSILSEI